MSFLSAVKAKSGRHAQIVLYDRCILMIFIILVNVFSQVIYFQDALKELR